MKKYIHLILLIFLVLSCDKESKKELIFLNKNAYELPVWQEMLLQDKVKFADIVLAFEAYKSTHKLDRETLKHFEKLKKRINEKLPVDGYLTSSEQKYRDLLAYRKATRNPNKSKTINNNLLATTIFKKEIPNSANYGNWKNVGPFGNPDIKWSATGNGAIQYIEMHPTNPAIMYAASRNGGLWKTINYGKNWTPETDYFATDNTSCIEISEHDPKIMYLGAAEDEKIWYTSNSGETWVDRSTGLSGEVYEIKSDPTDSKRAIAATTKGLYLTTNSGTSWTRKVTGNFTDIDVTENWDFLVVSNDSNNTDPTLHFTKDKGDTFIEKTITSSLTKVDKFYLAIHKPATGKTIVYAYAIKNNTTRPTRFAGLWKSEFTPNPTDKTSYFDFKEVKHTSYTYPKGAVPLIKADNTAGYTADTKDYYGSVNPYSTASWIGDFFVSPTNSDWLLTLREKVWGSEDGGVLWEYKPSYGGSHWADNRFITTNRAKDSLFWCNDGGMWAIKESDMFPTDAVVAASGMSKIDYSESKVVAKNGDICVIEGSQMDVSLMNKGVFMTGGQDVGQILARNGRDAHVASSDVYRGRIKPTDDTKHITGHLEVNLNGGTDVFNVYNYIDPDYFNADRLYGFTSKNKTKNVDDVRLVRSPAGLDGWTLEGFTGESVANKSGSVRIPTNKNWQEISLAAVGVTKMKPGTFEQSRANAELAFFGDAYGGKLFYTTNLSAETPTWTQLENAPRAVHYRIATHQFNENIIVLATNTGVYISKDKGITWNSRGKFFSSNPIEVLIDKNTNEGIYVLTELTAYYIDENLGDWVEFNKGLPLQNLTDMRIAYYPDGDNRLYISKYGRGVWSTSLQSVLNTKKKPIADFLIHGSSKKQINKGEKVKLYSESLNATSLEWKFENGADIITIADKIAPEVILNTAGFYKVTLKATNAVGSSTKIKEQFISVNKLPVTTDCAPQNDLTLSWWKGYNNIKLNEDNYDVTSLSGYIVANKTFNVKENETVSFYYDDNYTGSYIMYTKVWVDYNRDGDFEDANEEIISTNGISDTFTGSFTVPNNVASDVPLLMRVAGIESTTGPTSCQETGYSSHTIDFKLKVTADVNFTNIAHSNIAKNSVDIETTVTNASSVTKMGFVYSNLNIDLNLDNANVSVFGNTLPTTNKFKQTVTNLDYNTKYYYRPFATTIYGTHYGDIQSFQLPKYTFKVLEASSAINVEENTWDLKGIVFPENELYDELAIEYGTTSFDKTIVLDPTSYPTDKTYEVVKRITLPDTETYKFRLKGKKGTEEVISNLINFKKQTVTGTYCTPTATNDVWYARISNFTFNNISNNSKSSNTYEDSSSTVFTVNSGDEYTFSVTDSFSPGYNLNYLIFIDYNNDGDFDDVNELVARSFSDADTFTGTIKIPTEYAVFNTNLRMRVMGERYGLNGCVFYQGQAKDYSIKIEQNKWTGNTSNNWDLASNWSLNKVPTSTSNVLIPKGLSKYPSATGAVSINKIILEEKSQLTVTGALTNSKPIVLAPGASLIAKTSVSGKIAYTRKLPVKNKWYMISPPAKNINIQDLLKNNYFAKGGFANVGIITYNNSSSSWNYMQNNDSGIFTEGKGYAMRLLGPGELTFSGDMATEDVSTSINKNKDGFNLVGNPYPSYISVNNAANSTTNLLKLNDADNDYLNETTIWLWDSSLNGGQGDYRAINHASSKQFIAPGQAFFVEANGTHQFKFTEDVQSHQNEDGFRKTTNDRFKINLKVNDGTNTAFTEVYYINGTTTGWDNGYDSSTFDNPDNQLKLYSQLVANSTGQKLQIQSLPNSKYQEMVIPITVKGKSGITINFSADAINIPANLNVILEDRQKGEFTILENSSDNYSITLDSDTLISSRFYIHVNTISTLSTEDVTFKNIAIYVDNDRSTINVIGIANGNSKFQLFNIQGKEIYNTIFKSNGNISIKTPRISSGIYIAKVTNKNNKSVSKKIFIK